MPYKDPVKAKEAAKKRGSAWYQKNKARHIEWQKKYNEKNKEKVYAYQREWIKKDRELHPEKWARRDFSQTLRGHGTTIEWYEAKLAEQDGVCAICQRPESSVNVVRKTPMRLAVDHAHHGDKRLRGLLCNMCNGALARLEDVEGWAERALAYLRKYHPEKFDIVSVRG